MKRFFAFFAALMLFCIAIASSARATSLTAEDYINSVVNSVSEANGLKDANSFFDKESVEKSYDKYGIVITEYTDAFPPVAQYQLTGGIVYELYSTVQEVGRAIGNISQNHNPEITFDAEAQELSTARFYLTYQGVSSKEELLSAVDEYTDVIIDVLCDTYLNLKMDDIMISWCIPAINPDSLYSAVFWYDNVDGALTRNE